MKVLVLGAGLMGAQIGCEYALGGHEVTLVARNPEGVRARVRETLALVEQHGLAQEAAIEAARPRIVVAERLEPVPRCDVTVESLPEQLELKAELLRLVGEARPRAILASNTSSLSVTKLGEATGFPERVVGTHYWNPPLLMPLVEVVAGERTDPAVVERVRATLHELGKDTVLVERDVPGFLWNRLQFAILREALWIVENGVASAEEVDKAFRSGLARRWRQVGPFQAIALGGVDTWQGVGRNLVPELSTAQALPPLGPFLPDAGGLDEVRRRRDRALAAELIAERDSTS